MSGAWIQERTTKDHPGATDFSVAAPMLPSATVDYMTRHGPNTRRCGTMGGVGTRCFTNLFVWSAHGPSWSVDPWLVVTALGSFAAIS